MLHKNTTGEPVRVQFRDELGAAGWKTVQPGEDIEISTEYGENLGFAPIVNGKVIEPVKEAVPEEDVEDPVESSDDSETVEEVEIETTGPAEVIEEPSTKSPKKSKSKKKAKK